MANWTPTIVALRCSRSARIEQAWHFVAGWQYY